MSAKAVREGRLVVVSGDRKREWFPTAEARGHLRRFRNRARTSGDPIDRTPTLAIVFHKFFPKGRSEGQAQADAQDLASEVGFATGDVRIRRAFDARQLRTRLSDLGLSDPISVREPETFLEALHMFAREYPDDAAVSKAALDGALAWVYPRPAEVLADLCAIHRIYGTWRRADGSTILDPRDRSAVLRSERGCELAPESLDVQQEYRTAFFDEVDGTVCFHLHRKYAFNFTRIYFWFARQGSEDEIRTLVAHAGRHLPDGSENDR